MKELKIIINGVTHVWNDDGICNICSLEKKCDSCLTCLGSMFFNKNVLGAFQIEKQ
jgi:hypothetical protein